MELSQYIETKYADVDCEGIIDEIEFCKGIYLEHSMNPQHGISLERLYEILSRRIPGFKNQLEIYGKSSPNNT